MSGYRPGPCLVLHGLGSCCQLGHAVVEHGHLSCWGPGPSATLSVSQVPRGWGGWRRRPQKDVKGVGQGTVYWTPTGTMVQLAHGPLQQQMVAAENSRGELACGQLVRRGLRPCSFSSGARPTHWHVPPSEEQVCGPLLSPCSFGSLGCSFSAWFAHGWSSRNS